MGKSLRLALATPNREYGQEIGEFDGDFEEADNRDCNRLGKFLRIKISLDLKQPVKRGTVIRFQGKDLKVFFRYERLPAFCFICGKLGHQMKECDEEENNEDKDYEETDERDLPFGPWLRASPLPRQTIDPKKEPIQGSCSRSLFSSSNSGTAEAGGTAKEDREVNQPPKEKEPTLAQLMAKSNKVAKEVEEVAESLGFIDITPKIPEDRQNEVIKSNPKSKPKESASKARAKQRPWVRKKGRKTIIREGEAPKTVGVGKRQLFEDGGSGGEAVEVGGSHKKQATGMEVDVTNEGIEGVLINQHLLYQ